MVPLPVLVRPRTVVSGQLTYQVIFLTEFRGQFDVGLATDRRLSEVNLALESGVDMVSVLRFACRYRLCIMHRFVRPGGG
jgi:hypothetical protein